MHYRKTLNTCCAAFLLTVFSNAWALDNDTLDKLFDDFEGGTEKFVQALVKPDWESAKSIALDLEKQAKNLAELAKKDENKGWIFDSSNLHNHSMEMVEAVEQQDAAECVYLVSIFISHVGYIQSANTPWLKEFVGKQIEEVAAGLDAKDKDKTRDAAEHIHVSANKIVFSAVVGEEMYRHTRWIEEVRQINGLGDAIIGNVFEDDWETAKKNLSTIKLIYRKWAKAFR